MPLLQLYHPLDSATKHISSATHELYAYVPDKYGDLRNMVQNTKVLNTNLVRNRNSDRTKGLHCYIFCKVLLKDPCRSPVKNRAYTKCQNSHNLSRALEVNMISEFTA